MAGEEPHRAAAAEREVVARPTAGKRGRASAQLDDPGPVAGRSRHRRREVHGEVAVGGVERGRKRSGGVDDEQVAGLEELRQLLEARVL